MPEFDAGASEADFDRLTQERCWSQPEQVTLPSSGIEVVVCRPTSAYWRSRRTQWPPDLVEKCDFRCWSGERAELTAEERSFLVKEQMRIIEQAFIQARLSLGPLPGEVDSINLDRFDTEFIMNYLIGAASDADEPTTVN